MRTVIHEVIADIDDPAAEIVLMVHWVDDVHTELRLPGRRRGQRNSTSADIIATVRQLVLAASDDLIACNLNRNDLLTGNGNRWTRERATAMRSGYRIPVHGPAPEETEPYVNLGKAAKFIGITPKTLRIAAEAGEIDAIHPFAGRAFNLQPGCPHQPSGPKDCLARQNQTWFGRRTASGSAKPMWSNHIARWGL